LCVLWASKWSILAASDAMTEAADEMELAAFVATDLTVEAI